MTTVKASSPFVFSATETMKQPKSPKSPKALENPLLKSSSAFFVAPSLVQEHERSPMHTIPARSKRSVQATPGPPPKASLSLNSKLVSIAKVTSESPATPMTPPPASSPLYLSDTRKPASNGAATNSYHHWVVGYGFTNDSESDQMLQILQSYGRILSTKTNSNWIAVQYEDEISRARATSRQLVPVASVLCGISRANPQLLHDIATIDSSGRKSDDLQIDSLQRIHSIGKTPSLFEEDILIGRHGHVTLTTRQRQPSICDTIFYWYFNWGAAEPSLHQE